MTTPPTRSPFGSFPKIHQNLVAQKQYDILLQDQSHTINLLFLVSNEHFFARVVTGDLLNYSAPSWPNSI